MPFLRVVRDKRGYETTYLMHVYRDGNRQQTRILYVFRTPGGTRVGREPLESGIQRQLEAEYPEIAFDWQAVFQTRQVIDSAPEPRRPRKRSPEEGAATREPAGDKPSQPVTPPPFPSVIEGVTPDERVAFLAHWHGVARERVERISDPARKEALLTLAGRLDPTAWTDVDQITAGLEVAGEALERLSQVLARRRRRGKKRVQDAATTHSTQADASDPTDDAAPEA